MRETGIARELVFVRRERIIALRFFYRGLGSMVLGRIIESLRRRWGYDSDQGASQPEAPREPRTSGGRKPGSGEAPRDAEHRAAKTFGDFGLPEPLRKALAERGLSRCTPLQELALPPALRGEDLWVRAGEAAGRTLIFLLACFARLLGGSAATSAGPGPRALIVTARRDRVSRILRYATLLAKHSGLHVEAWTEVPPIPSGPGQAGEEVAEILITTPVPLLAQARQGSVRLDALEVLVFDELDEFRTLGLLPEAERVVSLAPPPESRQLMVFSGAGDEQLRELATRWLRPSHIRIDPDREAAARVRSVFYTVNSDEKQRVLLRLLREESKPRALVFVDERETAQQLAEDLKRAGLPASVMVAGVTSAERARALEDLRRGRIAALVATDRGLRGVAVEGVTLVVNYNLPRDAETYLARIARAGTAGREGRAVSFACEREAFHVPVLERGLGTVIRFEMPDLGASGGRKRRRRRRRATGHSNGGSDAGGHG